MKLAISSERGKVIQTPNNPNGEINNKERGTVIRNCLNKEMINDSFPFPSDSKTPDIRIPKLDNINANERIFKPDTPIVSIASLALNKDKICCGKPQNIRVPIAKIREILRPAAFSV